MIDYDTLKAWRFAPVVQRYDARDCRLYALGLNLGADPLDEDALAYVAQDPPAVVCTMPMALVRPGAWLRDPAVGIDYSRVVVGESALRLHAPLPPEAQIEGRHRVLRVTDKGAGRGALVTLLREIFDTATGRLLAEYEQVTFCRGDGGFAVDGRHDPAPDGPGWAEPDRAPDAALPLQTAPDQALIYRLSGDMNPLHADPAAARRAGFDRPILHGLSTLGMVGHALDRAARRAGGDGLRAVRARLSAPVFPGEALVLRVWHDGARALFRAVNGAGQEVVSRGIADFQKMD
jgi:acyl dehydratase